MTWISWYLAIGGALFVAATVSYARYRKYIDGAETISLVLLYLLWPIVVWAAIVIAIVIEAADWIGKHPLKWPRREKDE